MAIVIVDSQRDRSAVAGKCDRVCVLARQLQVGGHTIIGKVVKLDRMIFRGRELLVAVFAYKSVRFSPSGGKQVSVIGGYRHSVCGAENVIEAGKFFAAGRIETIGLVQR